MPTPQSTFPISVDREKQSTTASQDLYQEFRFVGSLAADNGVECELYVTLDPANAPQIDTVTISAGTTGDIYAINIDDGTTDETFYHVQEAADDATSIAAALARVADLHVGVRMTSAAGVITTSSAVPGTTITYDVSVSTTPGNLVVANTQAAAGDPANHALVGTFDIEFGIDSSLSGKPQVRITSDGTTKGWTDGAVPTAAVFSAAQGSSTNPLTIQSMMSNAGIAAPT